MANIRIYKIVISRIFVLVPAVLNIYTFNIFYLEILGNGYDNIRKGAVHCQM